MTTSLLCLTFKEPILQIALKTNHNLDATGVALMFAIDTVAYAGVSFLLNFVPEAKKTFSRI